MNTADISETLITLCSELVKGVNKPVEPYVLNSGDRGLLASLNQLSAQHASRSSNGGATIAAHADHVRYGLSLMNAWTPGGNPWANADWSASWKISSVTDQQWQAIQDDLRDESRQLLETLHTPMNVSRQEMNNIIGIIVHLAYHLGAIRQIERNARGPKESA
jgi:hypothetical protein